MEKVKRFNIYEKKGKKFAVIETNEGKSYSVNVALIEYALKNIKVVKEKNNEK